MIRCAVCQNEEYEGALFCGECGTPLWGSRANDSQQPPIQTLRFRSDRLASTPADPGAPRRSTAASASAPRNLSIRVQGLPNTLRLGDRDEYRLGRAEPGQTVKPDLDLAPYRALELGVSRLHGLLKVESRGLTFTDLGSTNGTHINGARIQAHNPQPLHDGDEVRLGKLVMHIFFETD